MLAAKKCGKKLLLTMAFCIAMMGLTACDSNNSDTGNGSESYSSVTVTESTEPVSSSETAESSIVESSVESSSLEESVADETEASDNFTVTADDAIAYVNNLMEQHSDAIGIDKIPVVFLAIHYDYMSEDARNAFIESFGMDASTLSNELNEYLDQSWDYLRRVRNKMAVGDYNASDQSYYERLVKLEELTMVEDYKTLAQQCDKAIYLNMYSVSADESAELIQNFENQENIKSSVEKFYHLMIQKSYYGKIVTLENIFN